MWRARPEPGRMNGGPKIRAAIPAITHVAAGSGTVYDTNDGESRSCEFSASHSYISALEWSGQDHSYALARTITFCRVQMPWVNDNVTLSEISIIAVD